VAALSEFVHVVVSDGSQDAGLAVLLLSRPPTNTMTRQVYREIAAAAAEMGARDDVAAVILFGGHEIFSAGDDMPELQTLSGPEADVACPGSRRRRGDPEADRRRDHRIRVGRRPHSGAGRRLADQR
jgi:enoyl-CoA hydratase/carnithine racemase